jgi:hypothetical protein
MNHTTSYRQINALSKVRIKGQLHCNRQLLYHGNPLQLRLSAAATGEALPETTH